MPDITLHIPENSRFSSSLNEIDMCLKEILLTEMRLADPRNSTGKVDTTGDVSYSYDFIINTPGIDYVKGTKLTVNGLYLEVTAVTETGGVAKYKVRYTSTHGSEDKSGTFDAEKVDPLATGTGCKIQVISNPKDNWLWNSDHVFQVDDLSTEDIFDTWLLRNTNKSIDVQYPLLAYKQNDIKTVFWGTGNRLNQWNISTPPANSTVELGDIVVIKAKEQKYNRIYGLKGEVNKITTDGYYLIYPNTTTKVIDAQGNWICFSRDELRQTGAKCPITYKAKAITGTYSVAVLVDNRDEAQYIRDHFILRCADANIWFRYKSPILNNTENQIYTVFEIPVLERYPSASDKLKGKGYIYGLGFDVNVWATITDTPIPEEVIEMVRMNLKIQNEEKYQKIIIT